MKNIKYQNNFFKTERNLRYGGLSDKMLFVRIDENNKIVAYLGQVRLSKG